jgi:hypothetical protein
MKNLFEISGDEIKRILSLHEESTKQQYLNVLNEGSGAFYKTTTVVKLNDEYNIPTGTIFKPTNKPGVLKATVPGTNYSTEGKVRWFKEDRVNIYFYCKQGKYYFDKDAISREPGKTPRYDDGGLSKNLVKNLCYTKKTDYLSTGRHSFGGIYEILPQTKFTKVKDGVSFKAEKNESQIYGGVFAGELRSNTKKTIVNAFFSCSDYKFYADKKVHTEDNGTVMTNTLKKQFCPTTTPDNGKRQKHSQQVQKGQQIQGGQQVQKGQQIQGGQQVNTYNTQIQQSLGGQSPTGQISDTDLDNILTKLG